MRRTFFSRDDNLCMKEDIIAIFDIGKTNKKLLLFNMSLKLVSEEEEKFPTIRDEDGFECDNIDLIENWIRKSVLELTRSEKFEPVAINFTTYGATLVYLDGQGRKLTPVYNYLKPIDSQIPEELYNRYGGKTEFCRRTASPALGMLNSGIQAFWLKKSKPDVFSKVRKILHLPQYFSYLLTGEIFSEHTSIGCHTAIWDFDNNGYHQWVTDEKMPFPQPVTVSTLREISFNGKRIKVGTGIHDSSASLAPYFSGSQGKFILISTGTWCINMNPFNGEVLTSDQLARDCLCYISINTEPVKSSRLFLGHMHDEAIKHMSYYFKIHENSFRLVKPDTRLMNKLMVKFETERVFISYENDVPVLKEEPDLFVFNNFIEGYHLLMVELADLTVDAVKMVIPEDDDIENIFITGGFSKNPLFLKLLASSFPDKRVYTSEIGNSTALGAANVTANAINGDVPVIPDLGLIEVRL
jgi:sugar (pentulose or hexulose) kinase